MGFATLTPPGSFRGRRSPRSSPSNASATRCPACAGYTLTPHGGCATISPAALQTRWEESLGARAALSPRSPVPVLDDLLARFRSGAPIETADPPTPAATVRNRPAPGDREKMISQIPPKPRAGATDAGRLEPVLRASDLAKHRSRSSGPKRPAMRTQSSWKANRCRYV